MVRYILLYLFRVVAAKHLDAALSYLRFGWFGEIDQTETSIILILGFQWPFTCLAEHLIDLSVALMAQSFTFVGMQASEWAPYIRCLPPHGGLHSTVCP